MVNLKYFIFKLYIDFKKWLYDFPKIGRYLRDKKCEKIFSRLSPGEIAIDLGANVGNVTKKMTRLGVLVYAIEPDPNAFKVLKEKFKTNENVVCLNKAVSDHSGVSRIYLHQKSNEDPVKWSTASSLISEKSNVDKDNFIECEVFDLAQFIESLFKPIGLLKIDIEGEEIKVLNKMIDLKLTARVRNIVVETHERIPSLKKPTEELIKKILLNKIKNIDLSWA